MPYARMANDSQRSMAALYRNRRDSVLSVNRLASRGKVAFVTSKPARAWLPYNSTGIGNHGEPCSAGI